MAVNRGPKSLTPLAGSGRPPLSHHRPNLPRHELRIAVSQLLGLRPLARRDGDDLFEDLLALLLQAHAFEDVAAIDVHVVGHARVEV